MNDLPLPAILQTLAFMPKNLLVKNTKSKEKQDNKGIEWLHVEIGPYTLIIEQKGTRILSSNYKHVLRRQGNTLTVTLEEPTQNLPILIIARTPPKQKQNRGAVYLGRANNSDKFVLYEATHQTSPPEGESAPKSKSQQTAATIQQPILTLVQQQKAA